LTTPAALRKFDPQSIASHDLLVVSLCRGVNNACFQIVSLHNQLHVSIYPTTAAAQQLSSSIALLCGLTMRIQRLRENCPALDLKAEEPPMLALVRSSYRFVTSPRYLICLFQDTT